MICSSASTNLGGRQGRPPSILIVHPLDWKHHGTWVEMPGRVLLTLLGPSAPCLALVVIDYPPCGEDLLTRAITDIHARRALERLEALGDLLGDIQILCAGIRRESIYTGQSPHVGYDDGLLATWRILRGMGLREVGDLRTRLTLGVAQNTPDITPRTTHFALWRGPGSMALQAQTVESTRVLGIRTHTQSSLPVGNSTPLPCNVLQFVTDILTSHKGDPHDQLRTWYADSPCATAASLDRRGGWRSEGVSVLNLGCAPSPADMWSPIMHWGRCSVGVDRLCVCCEALRVLATPSARTIWDTVARGRQRTRRKKYQGCEACTCAGMLAATCRDWCMAVRATRWGLRQVS